jgi:uncharacterized protein
VATVSEGVAGAFGQTKLGAGKLRAESCDCYYFGMELELSEIEVRVLGVLIEKETTTPEYYPLSVNALINACNQKSNRDPVMTLDEEAVRKALRSLTEQAMVRSAGGDSRVAKFEHRLNELYNFHRHEMAVLCVLMLRGPQTPGELRTRSERMYGFEDLDAVHAALNLLMRREPPIVKVLQRQPGTKESRYMHLLSGDVAVAEGDAGLEPEARGISEHAPAVASTIAERIRDVEEEVGQLRRELETLREQFASFQKQFQ